jgi:hypothetical protein
MGHGGKLPASRDVAAEARPAQVTRQRKVIHSTVLELGRQTHNFRARGQNLANHSATLLGTVKRNHRGRVSGRFRPSGDHAHSKVLLVIGTNEHETHV